MTDLTTARCCLYHDDPAAYDAAAEQAIQAVRDLGKLVLARAKELSAPIAGPPRSIRWCEQACDIILRDLHTNEVPA